MRYAILSDAEPRAALLRRFFAVVCQHCGDLPLHIAVWSNATEAVIAKLLEVYPQAAAEKSYVRGHQASR